MTIAGPAAAILRPIAEADLPAIVDVQASCYPPGMQEDAPVLRSRIRAAGATSLVAECEGRVCAYLFAYRSSLGAVTPLGAGFEVLAQGDTFYLHDLAVAPAAAGRGLGRLMAERLHALAGDIGLQHCALVSVQASRAFWERLGYREATCAPSARAALATYQAALYMARTARTSTVGASTIGAESIMGQEA